MSSSNIYGRLSLSLVSSDDILSNSIGEDGEMISQGNDPLLTEIEIDYVVCSLRQISRYRRSIRENGTHRLLQNEAVIECSPPKDQLDKGNKWNLKAVVEMKVAGETVIQESTSFDRLSPSFRVDLVPFDGPPATITVLFTQAFALCVSPLIPLQEKTDLRDFPLIVQEATFYVNKGLICSLSPVFHAMLYGSFCENSHSSLQIDDVTSRHMELFLQAIHGSLTVSSRNCESLLSLSDRFGVESLKSRCADQLIRVSQRSPIKDHGGFFDRLLLADKWRLAKLQAHLVEKMDRARLSALSEHKLVQLEPDTCLLLLTQAIKHLNK